MFFCSSFKLFEIYPLSSGKITFYTIPPERKLDAAHESSSIVQYWGAEFDLVSKLIILLKLCLYREYNCRLCSYIAMKFVYKAEGLLALIV